MNASPNLDPAALERLQRLGGELFVGKMLALFRSFTHAKITEAKAAQAHGNLDGVARAAHPIKSSAGNVGAVRVQDLAARLEALALRGTAAAGAADEGTTAIGTTSGLLDEMERAFADVKAELDRRSTTGEGDPLAPGNPSAPTE